METLRTLPGDDVRQIMWRFAERYDLQMAVQSARSVARGTVARLVADGARNSHEWTPQKQQLLEAFDASGLTSIYMDPDKGGFIEGPKNLALALVAFELAWVDAGAATASLATCLGLAPIHEKGTDEQRAEYMPQCVPPMPGEDRVCRRAAFALTEPLPYVGVDTGVLSGKMRIKDWPEGGEPVLQVEKRGRFITGMDFADIVTVAVETDDERIKTSCMIILEATDEGVFDRGAPTKKLVHQLSSTRDPVFSLTVPASRIIGGYTVQDGVIVPNYSHAEIIGAVFHRTRIPVGLMTSAKLLSAVEPIIRYHRQRFRGGSASTPGSPRFEKGIQANEDATLRLLDIWASGEAGTSLGFCASRMADLFDPVERAKDEYFKEQGVVGARKQFAALRKMAPQAIEHLAKGRPEGASDEAALGADATDPLVHFAVMDAMANVLIPACKLWNTGFGATMMREAVALVGGYGITEDCPGFLGQKWMDAQLEATYEGPEAVQRRHLTATMTNEIFLARLGQWPAELRAVAAEHPQTGAAALASAIELWLWTLAEMTSSKDPDGKKLYHGRRQGVTFLLADALCWLLGARLFIDDVLELAAKGPMNPVLAEGMEGLGGFYFDLAGVQAARAAGEVGKACAELVFGYKCAPEGQASPAEGGQCILFEGLDEFQRLRADIDARLTGHRMYKDRAAAALVDVMIPEALDYPI